jgi:hypothetical protein
MLYIALLLSVILLAVANMAVAGSRHPIWIIKQCVSCHGGERGDLLGAFSYSLRRQPR